MIIRYNFYFVYFYFVLHLVVIYKRKLLSFHSEWLKMRVINRNLVLLVSILCVSGDYNVVYNQHSLELTQSLNLARQEQIQERCSRYRLTWSVDDLPNNQLEHILIDDDRKLLYCYVPKVRWSRITSVFVVHTSLFFTTNIDVNINDFAFCIRKLCVL